jgi:hypothetical protein
VQRIFTIILGSVLAAVVAFSAITSAGDVAPVGEAPAVVDAPSLGGLTPLAPDTLTDDSFDPSQVQLEPGDPSPDDYVWDDDGNLVLRPDYTP